MDFHCLLCSFNHNPYMEKHLRLCIAAEKRFYAQNHWRASANPVQFFAPEPHEAIYAAMSTHNKSLTLQLLKQDISLL